MSRTYRRMKGYVPAYVKEAAEPLKGLDAEDAERKVKPETWYKGKIPYWYKNYAYIDGQWFQYGKNKALGQNNAMWFGDHGYAWRRLYGKDVRKMVRNWVQGKHRAEARMELVRFMQNPDYEVQIPRKNLLPWD